MDKEIAAVVATAGLEDLLENLLLQRRPWCRERGTWVVVWQGREVRFRTDYILGSDLRIFRNVAVRDLQHNSDHFMIMGCLCVASPWEHLQ